MRGAWLAGRARWPEIGLALDAFGAHVAALRAEGDAPSDEDLAFTRAVVEGAATIGTPLLDHVIVARRQSMSMLEAGVLPLPRAKALPRS